MGSTRRLVTVVVIAAAACAVIWVKLGHVAGLATSLLFTAVAVWVSAYDLYERRVPRRIVLSALGIALVLQAVTALYIGEPSPLLRALAGTAIAIAVLLPAHLIAPDALGFGDVLFAGLIGITLGWFGLWQVGLGLVLAFLIGALVAGPLTLSNRARRTAFPYVPVLAAGAWIALLIGDRIIDWYLQR